jgi:hypothetical protein
MDLSQNIVHYNETRVPMLNPDPNANRYYDYIGNVLYPPPSIQDGILEDNSMMAMNENNIWLAGTLTMSVLLIAAIMLARE